MEEEKKSTDSAPKDEHKSSEKSEHHKEHARHEHKKEHKHEHKDAYHETKSHAGKYYHIKLAKNTVHIVLGIIVVILIIVLARNYMGTAPGGDIVSTGGDNSGSELSSGSASSGDAMDYGTEYGTVDLQFYVMSQCPYGTQVEDGIAPVLQKFGNAINFELDFIGSGSPGKWNSLHGQPEVQGNKVQLCAIKYNSDDYMQMIQCMNKDAGSIPGNWEGCAEGAGLDVEKIKACYEGDEADELLGESFAKAQQAQASGSPTMYLDGQLFNGGRDSLSFTRAVCARLEGHPACADLPACGTDADCQKPGKIGKCVNAGQDSAECQYSDPVKVDLLVVNDKRCDNCDASRVISQLQQLFPGIELTELDYGTEEGKKVYDESGLTTLPALLFGESVTKAASYDQVKQYFEQAGDYLTIRIGATYDPTKEVCDNGVDDTGDGKVDCDDTDCQSLWECVQKSDKPTVELFVMSHCPYGTQMEKGILPVVELLGDKIDFQLKFVNYAMHGEKELDEQLAQYCINKEEPEKLTAYLRCFLGSASGTAADSANCIKESGINADAVSTCVEAADKEFGVKESFKDQSTWSGGRYPPFAIYEAENQKYGIRGSPSIRINGADPSSGRDSVSLLKSICYAFENAPAECGEDLSSEGTPAPGFGWTQAAAAQASASAGCGA